MYSHILGFLNQHCWYLLLETVLCIVEYLAASFASVEELFALDVSTKLQMTVKTKVWSTVPKGAESPLIKKNWHIHM